jgi:hypothetical protein
LHACHYYKHSPKILNSNDKIPLEKIKISDISIILERYQKCVIDKIEVKMLGKNQNGTILNCHKQEFRNFGSNSLLFSHFNFLPHISRVPSLWAEVRVPSSFTYIIFYLQIQELHIMRRINNFRPSCR